jgi:hypothetical protein
MTNRFRPALALLALAAPMGCADSGTQPGQGAALDGLQFEAEVEAPGESTISIRVTVKNATFSPKHVELLGGGCLVRKIVWLVPAQEPVLDDRARELPCQAISLPVELEPGEIRAIGSEPYRSNLREELADSFTPGTYRVTAVLTVEGESLLVPAGSVDLE